jgi:hypothetical protein
VRDTFSNISNSSGEQYEFAISGIREHGGIMADISGVMRVIPEVLKHHTDRLVLDVTDIRPRKTTISPTSVKAAHFPATTMNADGPPGPAETVERALGVPVAVRSYGPTASDTSPAEPLFLPAAA